MRLREVHVPTRGLDAMRRFYVGTLGLPETFAEPGRFSVRVGRSTLAFHEAGQDAGARHFAFNVPGDRIHDAHAWIAPRAPVVADEGGGGGGGGGEPIVAFDAWDAHAVYFRDPGGHVVELIARHGLPDRVGGPFGPHALLEVSEAGIPVPDVGAAVRALRETLGESPWKRPSDAFAAVGDQRGLLILVREGRPWFPTDEAAATRPSALRVEAARAYHGAPPAALGGVDLRATRRDPADAEP